MGPTMDEMELFLLRWAAKNDAVYDPNGECGFMRECVGISKNETYPDWEWQVSETDWETHPNCVPEASPENVPGGVPDAYHKHPCLAVLGRGEEAVHQLYRWVKHLDENDVVIVTEGREIKPGEDPFVTMLLGTEVHRLVCKKEES